MEHFAASAERRVLSVGQECAHPDWLAARRVPHPHGRFPACRDNPLRIRRPRYFIGCTWLTGQGQRQGAIAAPDINITYGACCGEPLIVGAPRSAMYPAVGRLNAHDGRAVDLPDLQGLIAPRPLLIDIGANDTCFKVDTALLCYRQLERIYDAAGAGDYLELDLHPGEHAWGGNRSVAFFGRHLA